MQERASVGSVALSQLERGPSRKGLLPPQWAPHLWPESSELLTERSASSTGGVDLFLGRTTAQRNHVPDSLFQQLFHTCK